MSKLRGALAASIVLALGSPAPSSSKEPVLTAVEVLPETPDQTKRNAGEDGPITISRRPWYPICAGVCPSFDLTVWPDGRVVSIDYSFTGESGKDGARWSIFKTYRHRVSARQVRAFRAALESWRPEGIHFLHERCLHNDPDFPDADLPPTREVEIRWLPIGHAVGCDYDTALTDAVWQALQAIGFNIAGGR